MTKNIINIDIPQVTFNDIWELISRELEEFDDRSYSQIIALAAGITGNKMRDRAIAYRYYNLLPKVCEAGKPIKRRLKLDDSKCLLYECCVEVAATAPLSFGKLPPEDDLLRRVKSEWRRCA